MTNKKQEIFNLSEKIQDSSEFKGNWLWSSDVKEFIKRLKEELEMLYVILITIFYDKNVTWATWKRQLNIHIDKLAGDKLI